jgi:hypothetical protein
LDYYRARYYSPTYQRFVSQDPLDYLSDSKDLYSYAGDSPIDDNDPLGLRPLSTCEKDRLRPFIPQVDLDSADIHENGLPWYVGWLSQKFSGITIYNDIYFQHYSPCKLEGMQRLAHELTHVGQ